MQPRKNPAAEGHGQGTAIGSVVNDDFAAGFIVMERTLRHHNPEWDFPVVAIQGADDLLCDRSRGLIRDHCENVHFVTADPVFIAPIHAYARDVLGTPRRLWPAFSLLDAMSWSAFEQVILLDSDIIVRGSLEALRHAPAPFNAVRAMDAGTDEPKRYFNTGVMVFNSTLLTGFDPMQLMEGLGNRKPRPGTGKADQAILNLLMHNQVTGYLPLRFNFTKRTLFNRLRVENPATLQDPDAIEAWLDAHDVAILHYVGEKPWNGKVWATERAYGAIDALWHREVARHGHRSLYMELDRQARDWQSRYHESLGEAQRKKITEPRRIQQFIAAAMGL